MTIALVQGSPEWLAIRCGKVTASRVADVVAKTKTGYGSSRANYAAELIAERLTGQPAVAFTNMALQRGTELEPEARSAYGLHANCDVVEVGFVPHPTISDSGASPDGLVGDEGLVECKCPNTANHLETLLGGSIKNNYLLQCQWQLACTGRKWVDFCSYDPRLGGSMCLFVKRLYRDDAVISELEREVIKFLVEIDAKINDLIKRYGAKVAA